MVLSLHSRIISYWRDNVVSKDPPGFSLAKAIVKARPPFILWQDKHKKLCEVTPLKPNGAMNTVRKNSVNVWDLETSCILFAIVRNMDQKVETSKNARNTYLQCVPDQLDCQGYVGLQVAALNSLTDQKSNKAIWSQNGLSIYRQTSK